MTTVVPTEQPDARRKVCVIGAGYVGLTAAACMSHLGHQVACVETDPGRLGQLRRGTVPIHEPGLDELVANGLADGSLAFFDDAAQALPGAEVAFLCVGTPPQPTGEPNLTYLAAAARDVAAAATQDLVVVVKSTVPPGTCEAIELVCAEHARPGVRVPVVSSPEFLRESRAVEDFLAPDRVVVGAQDPAVGRTVASLYPSGCPVVHTDRRGAELIKYAANTLLAIKISFANEVAGLCDALGTDASTVLQGVGLDHRLGTAFLGPGAGYGGSCLPKDVSGFRAVGEALGAPTYLAEAAEKQNSLAREGVVRKLERILGPLAGRRVAVLGTAFKAGTDDTRDSPGLDIARQLADAGALVRSHDPLAREAAPGRVESVLDALTDADAVVVTTRAAEYTGLPARAVAAAMAGRTVVDAAGALDMDQYMRAGLALYGVGRGLPMEFPAIVWPPLLWAHPSPSPVGA
jgi:UDPglucose 6-dehydrogenase